MQIKLVDQEGKEQVPEAVQPKDPESTTITGDMLNQSVGQIFNLRPNEIVQNKEQIELLLDYAKTQTDDKSLEGLKWAIRNLQDKVGTPPLGQRWLPYLSKYCYIKLESMKFAKEAEKYERSYN